MERDRGGDRVSIEFNADAAPSKVFIVVLYASFPRFSCSSEKIKKTRNYHRRIVCENDREVFRGHVARARCRDAALPDATTVLSTAQERPPILFIYLNMYNIYLLSPSCDWFVLIICSIKITSSININYEVKWLVQNLCYLSK